MGFLFVVFIGGKWFLCGDWKYKLFGGNVDKFLFVVLGCVLYSFMFFFLDCLFVFFGCVILIDLIVFVFF